MDEFLYTFSGDHRALVFFLKIRFSKEFMTPNNCPKEGKCKRNYTWASPERNLQKRLEGAVGSLHFLPPFRDMQVFKIMTWDFPGGTVVKNLPANTGDTGLSSALGRSYMLRSN